jgi:hypothetical protein
LRFFVEKPDASMELFVGDRLRFVDFSCSCCIGKLFKMNHDKVGMGFGPDRTSGHVTLWVWHFGSISLLAQSLQNQFEGLFKVGPMEPHVGATLRNRYGSQSARFDEGDALRQPDKQPFRRKLLVMVPFPQTETTIVRDFLVEAPQPAVFAREFRHVLRGNVDEIANLDPRIHSIFVRWGVTFSFLKHVSEGQTEREEANLKVRFKRETNRKKNTPKRTMEDTWFGSAIQRTPLTSRDQAFVLSHPVNRVDIYKHYCQQGCGDGSGYFYTGWRQNWNADFCQLAANELRADAPKQ